MFSGLVRNIGVVERFEGGKITVQSDLHPKIGASIAINGICTTAISTQGGAFCAILSEETRKCVAIENLQKPRAKVHLEEALRASDRLDGHIMQGHIDSIGEILRVEKSGEGVDFIIGYEAKIRPMLIPKGSVAIDGISLTINALDSASFRLTIIPHTFHSTLFHSYKPTQRVNIETDIFARSVYHILQNMADSAKVQKSAESRLDSALDSVPDSANVWRKIDNILMSY